jgi:hypothetical protein
MAWTSPTTWAAALVTVSQFNEQIRDNFRAIKNPPSGHSLVSARNYVVAGAGAWTAVDTGLVAGHLQHAVTVAETRVVASFRGTIEPRNNTGELGMNISVDGTPYLPGAGILWDASALSGRAFPIYWTLTLTGLTPGSHTFRVDWSANVTGFVLYGSGVAGRFTPIEFMVAER